MSRVSLLLLGQLLFLAGAEMLSAQTGLPEDRPPVHVPVKKPTRQDLDRAEAQKLFALAVLLERDNKLIEALKTFEDAQRLDPDATPITRALVPLYLALDRTAEVYRCCERVLEQEPDDFDTGYLYARQLRLNDRSADALAVLQKLAGRPGLKDSPEMLARINYDRGLLHEHFSEWPEAVAAYQQTVAVLDHPAALAEQGNYTKEELINQAAETYERLGRAELKQKKTQEAAAAFEQAKKRDPLRAARLSYNLAEVLNSQGEYREALLRLNEYLSTLPLGMEAYELKIQLLGKLDRTGEIIPDLEEASGRDPHNQSLKLLLAREYRRARRTNAAEEVYQQLIKARPTPEVYKELFALYKDQGDGLPRVLNLLDASIKRGAGKEEGTGDATEAARARSMLVVLREDAALVKDLLAVVQRRIATRGADLEYQTRMLFASLASRAHLLDLAEKLYRGCLEGGGPRQKEHEVYTGLVRVLELAHKNREVIEVCKQGLEQAQMTNRVVFHLYRSQAYMNLGRTKEALASADDAVNESAEKDRLTCQINQVDLLRQAEKQEQALAECQALLKQYNLPGDQRQIRYTLAGVYSAAKEQEKAEAQLQLILDADPGEARAHNDLGYLWADQNRNLEQAEKLIRKALELDQKQRREGAWIGLDADLDNAAYIDSLGWVLFRRGQLKEALQELERASKLPGGEDDPVVWDHLGDVLFRSGERARAQQAWKKALELYEVEQRRRPDDHYRELKQKLRQAEP
jgi:tetratricopeptide (TPR) repeat protein